jgi:ribosomal protein L40E
MTPAESVTLVEINRQRSIGWPDFHPEDYCHRCGARNVSSWAVDADEWRTAGIDGRWNEIICPQCFAELWQEATDRRVTWWLSLAHDGGNP